MVAEGRFIEAKDACIEMLRAWGNTRGPDFFQALITTITAHGRVGDFGAALGFLEEAERRAANDADQFICLKFNGNCQLGLGDFERAMASFQAAWRLAVSMGDVPRQASVLNNIGIIHREFDDPASAISHFSRARDLGPPDSLGGRIARYNLGATLLDTGAVDAAMTEFEWVLADSRRHRDILHEGLVLHGLGELAESGGDSDAARAHFAAAETLLTESGDSRARLQVDIERAEKLARREETREGAIARIARAVTEATSLGGRILIKALGTQVEILTCAGRIEEALSASRRHAQLEKENHQQDSRGRLGSLRVLHELDSLKHEAEIARLKNEDLARALAEADRQRERAERSNAFTKGVLAMAAHDLRNPIGSVEGILELLSHETDPVERAELTSLALDQIHVTQELLNRLMDSVLVQRGEMRLRCEALDLVSLATSTVRAHTSAATRKGQHIVLKPAEHPVMVDGDAVRLRQVLENLLSNAIKYSPPGAVVTVTAETCTGHFATVCVTDEGPGVPRGDRDRIFEPFSRLDGIQTTGGEGSIGLGLHLARELTLAHHGTLTVQPGPERGSTFVLQLPLKPNAIA